MRSKEGVFQGELVEGGAVEVSQGRLLRWSS